MKHLVLFLLFCIGCNAVFGQEKPLPPQLVDFIPVFSGIEGGESLSGSWQTKPGGLVQSDAAARWAKYRIRFVNESSDYIFRFRIQAVSREWVGGGLHIFASGGNAGSGYAYGSSWLVWVTRDAIYYKNGRTYLQLYRSFNNSLMIQVASVSIPEDVEQGVTVDVYYNRNNEILSLSANGDLKLFFPVKSTEAAGVEIVLRALGGPVSIEGLEILAPVP